MAEDPTPSDNPEGEDRPEWLPENFKSPEDLANSYKESQRKITEETTARRNLEAIVTQQQSAIEQLQQQATAQPEQEEPWDDWYAQDPIATQKALAERAAEQRFNQLMAQAQQQQGPVQATTVEVVAELAFNKLQAEKGELSPEFRAAMSEIVAEKPYLIPDHAYQSPAQLAQALDVVYSLASTKVAPAAEGQTQADLMRTMKLQAQTSEGASGRTPSADEAAVRWSEIANAPSGKLGL